MNELRNCDSMLKRFLKRKVKVTDALVVTFLITGGFAFAAPTIPTQESLGVNRFIETMVDDFPEIPFIEIPDADLDITKTAVNTDTIPHEDWKGHQVHITSDTDFNDENLSGGIGAGYRIGDGNKIKAEGIINQGEIQGNGFGMLADGSLESIEDIIYDLRGFNTAHDFIVPVVTNQGIINTTGDVGIGAIGGGKGYNNAIVKNDGNYGMYAKGGSGLVDNNGYIQDENILEIKGGKDTVTIDNNFSYIENNGIVINTGDIGMYAGDGATGVNNGYIGVDEDGNGVGNFGMVAQGGSNVIYGDGSIAFKASQVANSEIIANSGDFGMAALDGALAINTGEILNGGDFGMVAIGGTGNDSDYTAESFSPNLDPEMDRYFTYYSPSLAINEGGFIQNGGNYGMAAVDGGIALNIGGGIENGGDFGMVAIGSTSATLEVTKEVAPPYRGYDPGLSSSVSIDYYSRSVAVNTGEISNGGNYGMGALDGGIALNIDGLVANAGDFGMVAAGGNFNGGIGINFENIDPDSEFGEELAGLSEELSGIIPDGGTITGLDLSIFASSLAVNYEGEILNGGNYGMASLDGGIALNIDGLVANDGDFGMVAVGGEREAEISISIEGDVPTLRSPIGFETSLSLGYYAPSLALNIDGQISNGGDFGMAAVDGAMALNIDGLVANDGDFGMVAAGKAEDVEFSVEYMENEEIVFEESFTRDFASLAFNNGLIQNNGDYGMAAVDGAYAINTGLIEGEYNGVINNTGNVGMLLTEDSVGLNIEGYITPQGDVGVLMDGDSTFLNFGYVIPNFYDVTEPEPEDWVPNPNGVGVQAGNGNNTMYLSGEIYGTVNGGNGTNTLLYIPELISHDEDDYSFNSYGDIVDNTFSHLGSFGSGTLNIDRDLQLRMSQNTNKTDYNKDANGKINFDQFNGFEFTSLTGAPIDSVIFEDVLQDALETVFEPIWRDDIYSVGGFYESLVGEVIGGIAGMGDIVIEEDSNLTLTLGQNRVSVIAANSISGDGTITQRTLDQFFTTDAVEIEVKNILVSNVAPMDIDPTINFDINMMETENVAEGWEVKYVQNDDGSISTIYYRTAGVSTNSLLGGYRESTQHYTQSNVDILNSNLIRDKGYGYARAFAFEKPEIITTTETVAKTNPKTVTKGKEVTPLPATTLETLTKTTEKMFKWTQFAELSGEGGKYDGSTNQNYDYSTFGVTGGTFTRLPEDWTAGLTYGYARSKVDYSSGKENLNSLGANLFATKKYNNWLGTLSAGYAWSRHDLDRSVFDRDSLVEVGIIGENHLSADFDSHIWNTGLEIGYDFPMKGEYNLYTYVGFDYSWYRRDGYTESGAGNLAMDLEKIDYGMPQSKLGAQFDAAIDKWDLTADLAWYHIFYDAEKDGKTYGNFKNMNSDSTWKIPGLNIGKDIGVLRLAADYEINQQMSVGVEYNGYVRDGEFGNRGALNFNYKW